MKRTLDCTDSLGALISICPATTGSSEEHQVAVGNNNNNSSHIGQQRQLYGREFESALELEEDDSGGCVWGEKKRRLSVEQVKALEKSFEVENKLEPDRKVKLAQDLGLQPRQVAVWFQNRRARWKTKQLERDYGVLKANYDSLQHKYEALHHDNDSLLKQIKELKSKLKIDTELDDDDEECYDNNIINNNNNNETSVKGESTFVSNFDMKTNGMMINSPIVVSEPPLDLNFEGVHGSSVPASVFTDVKDGSSDSDSSAILNEAGDGAAATSLFHAHHHQFMAAAPSMIKFGCGVGGGGEEGVNFMSESEEKAAAAAAVAVQKGYQPQFVKVEEYNFFSGEEACNLFSDEQAPTLPWYCPTDQWN